LKNKTSKLEKQVNLRNK